MLLWELSDELLASVKELLASVKELLMVLAKELLMVLAKELLMVLVKELSSVLSTKIPISPCAHQNWWRFLRMTIDHSHSIDGCP